MVIDGYDANVAGFRAGGSAPPGLFAGIVDETGKVLASSISKGLLSDRADDYHVELHVTFPVKKGWQIQLRSPSLMAEYMTYRFSVVFFSLT